LKKFLPLLLLAYLTFTAGCASTGDLRRVQGDIDRKILIAKEDNAGIRKDVEKLNEATAALRKNQAEVNASISEKKDSIQNLKGITEGLKKDISILKEIREKIDDVSFKINFIENFLDIGKKENHSEGDKIGRIASKNSIKGKTDKESIYALAYETFKEGKYEKASGEFENFLKQYPDTEYSDNAQFWIGECYYFENKYEKAILEYEKVIKNYPKGNKVPYALLKQGFSFLNLGDKSSAKLILQQIIKNYPDTNQARIAREKLVEIK